MENTIFPKYVQNITKTADLWTCNKCGKEFVDNDSLQLHLNLHTASEKYLTETELALRRNILYKEVKKQQDEELQRDGVYIKSLTDLTPYKPRRIYRPTSKRVGFTKIRMEDCLRCDACSCIYIDQQDYYKHMRNFHQKYNTIIPRTRRKSPVNHKCCNGCAAQSSDEAACEKLSQEVISSPPINDKYIREKIKNRWSQVSKRFNQSSQMKTPASGLRMELISRQTPVKEEPVDDSADMSYLLSQVEVRIKTEPPDIQ